MLLLLSPTGYANLQYAPAIRPQTARQSLQLKTGEKIGFFKKFKFAKALKKSMKRPMPAEYERASPRALTALGLFIGSFLIWWLPVGFFFVYVSALGFLISIILACLVLFVEENRKSRTIAKIILITAGVAILAVLAVVIVAINSLG